MESCLKEEDSSPEETTGVEIKKCCSACKTSTTPLWRSGPTGPKSLCNACGIRHRKKKGGPNTATGDVKKKIGKTRKLVPLGWVVEEGRRRRGEPEPEPEPEPAKNPTRWGEVERAALLLMALSCGVVFG